MNLQLEHPAADRNMRMPFVLCADDYSMSPGVSAGIRDLILARRLSATSCLVVSPFWRVEGRTLRDLAPNTDIGLHLALTQLTPIGPMPQLTRAGRLPSIGRLMALAYARRLNTVEIGDEIDRQFDAFENMMGRSPDYVDGHHHVHQLPVIRDLLIERFHKRLPPATAMRVCDEPLAAIWHRGNSGLRASVIALSARALRRALEGAGIPRNQRFSGIRNFSERIPYRDLFRSFIADRSKQRPEGLLVMCHPGYPDGPLRALDDAVETRASELAYLMGDEFPADLEVAKMRLGRFPEISPLLAPRSSKRERQKTN